MGVGIIWTCSRQALGTWWGMEVVVVLLATGPCHILSLSSSVKNLMPSPLPWNEHAGSSHFKWTQRTWHECIPYRQKCIWIHILSHLALNVYKNKTEGIGQLYSLVERSGPNSYRWSGKSHCVCMNWLLLPTLAFTMQAHMIWSTWSKGQVNISVITCRT